MDNTDFILHNSEATRQIKRLELDTRHPANTPRRLSISIILSVVLHGGAIAAVAGIVNELSTAIAIQTPTVITAHLVTESGINTNAIEASETVPTQAIPKESADPITHVTAEEELESVITTTELLKQVIEKKTLDSEVSQVSRPEPADAPPQAIEADTAGPSESEPEIVTDKKTTQSIAKRSNDSIKAETIESTENALATESLIENNNSSSEIAFANEQPSLIAKADRSVFDGAGQHRDAAPASGNAKPRYPRVAIKKGYEGSVVLHVTVNSAGDVKDIVVGTGSGYRSLDKSAISAVKRWRFEPAIKNGEAVESVAEVPVVFRLVDARS